MRSSSCFAHTVSNSTFEVEFVVLVSLSKTFSALAVSSTSPISSVRQLALLWVKDTIRMVFAPVALAMGTKSCGGTQLWRAEPAVPRDALGAHSECWENGQIQINCATLRKSWTSYPQNAVKSPWKTETFCFPKSGHYLNITEICREFIGTQTHNIDVQTDCSDSFPCNKHFTITVHFHALLNGR